jgi:hypothetical protein
MVAMKSNMGPNDLLDTLHAVDASITRTEEGLPRLRRLANHRTAVPPGGQRYADLFTEAEARLEALYERRDQLLARLASRQVGTADHPARRAADNQHGFSPL